MIGWTGATSGKLMFVIRKPTPLGILLNTMCDAASGVMLNAEFNEGAELDKLKEYHEKYGSHTSIVLRLAKPYHRTGRYIVGDARFGSYK
jgi:hypothetical protein